MFDRGFVCVRVCTKEFVFVCVYVRERETEREREYVCVSVSVSVCVMVFVCRSLLGGWGMGQGGHGTCRQGAELVIVQTPGVCSRGGQRAQTTTPPTPTSGTLLHTLPLWDARDPLCGIPNPHLTRP